MSGSDDSDKRRHERTPLSLLVQFRFETFDDFITDYSANISPGGIFIKTEKPQEEGVIIYMQFSLNDGARLIEGMGKVVRCNKPGGSGPVGMGIEFVNLDDESVQLIEEICEARRQNGSKR